MKNILRILLIVVMATVVNCRKETGEKEQLSVSGPVAVKKDTLHIKETVTGVKDVKSKFDSLQALARRSPANGFNGCQVTDVIYSTKAKATIEGKRLNGNWNMCEVGALFTLRMASGAWSIQTAYRHSDRGTIPFTDYNISPYVSVGILNGGTAPFYINDYNEFELYRVDEAGYVYQYRRNGVDVLQFTFVEPAIITNMNIHCLTVGSAGLPLIKSYPAFQYADAFGFYIHARGGRNIYCAGSSVFIGNATNPAIVARNNELYIDDGFINPGCGAVLFSN